MHTLSRQRVLWIDVLKGLAIILVVIGHSAVECGLNYWSNWIYTFHMPLFFLISGFLFTPQSEKCYFHKSFRRLIIPFIAFVILLAFPYFVHWIINFSATGFIGIIRPMKIMIAGGVMATAGWYTVAWFVVVLWMSANLFNFISSRGWPPLFLIPLLVIAYVSSLLPSNVPFRITVVPMATAYIWLGFLINIYICKNLGTLMC